MHACRPSSGSSSDAIAAAAANETAPFTEAELHALYTWVDSIALSRPKRNIARDFADGCCVAEIMHYYFPRLVELHNYTQSMAHARKVDNWRALNARVFRRLYFEVPDAEIEDIVAAVPGAIERFLRALRIKIAQIQARRGVGDAAAATGSTTASRKAEATTVMTTQTNKAHDKDAVRCIDANEVHADAMTTMARSPPRPSSRCAHGDAARVLSSSSMRHTPQRVNAARAAVPFDAHCALHHRTLHVDDDGGHQRRQQPLQLHSDTEARAGETAPASLSAMHKDATTNGGASASASFATDGAARERAMSRLLAEKDCTIVELRETVGILSEKIAKLEELVRVKDEKLSQYRSKFGRM